MPDSNIDGIDQWDTIKNNAPGKRDEFVYAINELNGRGAIRWVMLHNDIIKFIPPNKDTKVMFLSVKYLHSALMQRSATLSS